jgi:hypothetical protein
MGFRNGRGKLAGVIVACRRAHRDVMRRPCGEDGEIVELICGSPDRRTVEKLVVPVMGELASEGVDAVAVTGLQRTLHPVLEQLGFERTECPWGTLFAVSSAPAHPVKAILRDDLWYFTSGDGDHMFDQEL